MKFLNDFKNLFAIVGVVSIIFWTCASESTSDTTNVNPPQLTGGTYQVAYSGVYNQMVILNTETGVLKSYYYNTDTASEWTEGTYHNSNSIGSGNLTVNH